MLPTCPVGPFSTVLIVCRHPQRPWTLSRADGDPLTCILSLLWSMCAGFQTGLPSVIVIQVIHYIKQ